MSFPGVPENLQEPDDRTGKETKALNMSEMKSNIEDIFIFSNSFRFQVEVAFAKFDQTGNNMLDYRFNHKSSSVEHLLR